MGTTMNTARVAFTWDQEYKPRIDEIKTQLLEKTEFGDNTLSSLRLFMLCLAYGYSAGKKRPRPPRKSDAARLEGLTPQYEALFRAIAIKETGGYEILLDDEKVLDIIEEYAAGGLGLLVETLDSEGGNLRRWISGDMYKIFKDYLLGLPKTEINPQEN